MELKGDSGGGGGRGVGDSTKYMFAAKVMDKKELVSRNKDGRAKTERDILEILDHPFLPTLCATLDTPIPVSLKLGRKYAYLDMDHVCFLLKFDV